MDFPDLYNSFNLPVMPFDCGKLCAPHNPNLKPFCCDICHAVPSVYHQEWDYLVGHTDLWHLWRGDECIGSTEDPRNLMAETPDTMCLVVCLGPDHCQRNYRSLSCRQFPFFPYITSDNIFIGLAYNWGFEETCWVISHLDQVSDDFRVGFVQFYDQFFQNNPGDIKTYAQRSFQMRSDFMVQKRSIPLLNRDGGYYLLRPINQRLRPVEPGRLPLFGVYQEKDQ